MPFLSNELPIFLHRWKERIDFSEKKGGSRIHLSHFSQYIKSRRTISISKSQKITILSSSACLSVELIKSWYIFFWNNKCWQNVSVNEITLKFHSLCRNINQIILWVISYVLILQILQFLKCLLMHGYSLLANYERQCISEIHFMLIICNK